MGSRPPSFRSTRVTEGPPMGISSRIDARSGARDLSTLARLRRVIARVPRGKVITYGQVAAAGGFPGAARLTVWALQRGEGLPWHRVVAAGGRIALPGESGQEQCLRLQIEGVKFRRGRVRMDLHNWIPDARGAKARKSGRSSSDSYHMLTPIPFREPSQDIGASDFRTERTPRRHRPTP